MTEIDINTRVCTTCNVLHPIELFFFKKKGEPQRMTKCKACCKVSAQKWQAENKEKKREKWMEWVRNHPEQFAATQKKYKDANREAVRERQRKYVAENKEAVLEASRIRYAAGKDKHRALVYRWRVRNPIAYRAHVSNYRARKLSAEGSHTRDDIARLGTLQRGRCAYCEKKLNGKFHIDHVMPLFLGGSNWKDNLQLLCVTCNTRKQASHPVDYARKLGKLI